MSNEYDVYVAVEGGFAVDIVMEVGADGADGAPGSIAPIPDGRLVGNNSGSTAPPTGLTPS
jgi:hypothetical protein